MSDAVQWVATMAACAAAATALLAPTQHARARAMIAAIAILPPMLLAELWDREELRALRDTPGRLAAIVVLVLVAVALLTILFRRRPEALPLAIVAALPFRIPVGAAGQDANLLLPLYVVIAAGVLVAAAAARSGATGPPPPPSGKAARWLSILLAVSVALYGLQAAYSTDLDHATETVGFFLVPFAVMFTLLLNARLSPRVIRGMVLIAACETLVFALVAFGQYEARHLFWNDEVITANEFQPYFRVNSLFWDPNIFGRYLAMVIVVLTACLLWARARRPTLGFGVAVAVLWGALVLTFSQSSFAALLGGLVVLAALRWSLRWTAIVTGTGAALALVYLLAFGSGSHFKVGSERALDRTTSGRADLVRGGLELAQRRPIWGFGSGSFVQSFREESAHHVKVAASHTEPVTIAAEQGLLGLGVYVGLLIAALAAVFGPLRGVVPGLGPRGHSQDGRAPPARDVVIARAAVAAAFVALLVHTMTYAAFLSDPLTWTLLAIGLVVGRPAAPEVVPAAEPATIAPATRPAASSV